MPGRPAFTENLRQLLHAYEPLDNSTRVMKQRALELADRGGRALARTHLSPGHFTASAFILSEDDRALLLIHHKKLGLWLQPGGHIEPEDESAYSAALREAREETGQATLTALSKGLLHLDIHPIPETQREAAHEHFDLRFLFRSGDNTLQHSSEVLDARWVPLSDLVSLEPNPDTGRVTLGTLTTDRSVLEVAQRIVHTLGHP